MQNNSVKHIRVRKVSSGSIVDFTDQLAVEEPLEIRISYKNQGNPVVKSISVTMRTPGNDAELAAGFLFTEGIVKKSDQITDIRTDLFDENKVTVVFNENEIPQLHTAERNFYTTSSCGVCGKSSIEAIKTVSVYQNQDDTIQVAADLFYNLQNALKKRQEVFQNTGGLHASALFNQQGDFLLLREDVGRHNALDKVIGTSFLNKQLPLKNSILLLSGRASFELIQKASMAGIKIVAAIGAPSSLALRLAEDFGITLIGFLGNEKFNIYTGSQRIII
ncbi:formate dehydrogenase accessory sulfurtransferase FdhD [Dyadobacter sp. LHD-138]|uniref:formate dehydrogenase accessory sulfurtransferase FdhD n=1 Tax=Dyadobacter sp. LHD-138 TaxID=3071413 RepID=UPI0027DF38B8|nr:formate dehydrogenase accessory sulfurtransferase FdhD [Dyadobacter sp. LHD-138]MDQ6477374.1 formate dehydrogenase accessory sulfurtransferase FdhD [Dyadobacter sp. LHD-138]